MTSTKQIPERFLSLRLSSLIYLLGLSLCILLQNQKQRFINYNMASMASKLSKSDFRSKRLSNFKLDKRLLSSFRSDTHVSDYAFTFVLNIDLFYDKKKQLYADSLFGNGEIHFGQIISLTTESFVSKSLRLGQTCFVTLALLANFYR
jgi:hypothetical protein